MDTKIKACRICLNTDVKMFYIDNVLEDYISILASDILCRRFPNYICFECASLLVKFIKFRNKCLAAQSILSNVIKECGEINEDKIKGINHSTSVLKSHLGHKQLHSISLIKNTNTNVELVIHEETTTDDEGTMLDDEFQDVGYEHDYGKREMIDDQPEDVEMELTQADSSAAEDQSDDDTPIMFVVIANESTEEKEDSHNKEVEEVQKHYRGRKKRARVLPSKAKELKPKQNKNTSKAIDKDIDLTKYVTIIELSMEEQLEELKKRQQSSNYKNAPYQCNLCYRGFIHTQAWKHHLLKHDPIAGDVECPICKLRFKKAGLLNVHSKSIHDKKYICKSCPHVCGSEAKARLHQKWHDGVTYTCQYCDEVYTKFTSYLGHLRIKHPSNFICDLCGNSFVSKLGLRMHKKIIHKNITKAADGETKPGPYCKECDIKFVSVEAWNRHMVTSVKHKQTAHIRNVCRVCGKTFKSSDERLAHHKKEHARKPVRNFGNSTDTNSKGEQGQGSDVTGPFNCQHCPEQFSNRRECFHHYQRKHPYENYPIQRNHICDICGKCYPNSTVLAQHKWRHSDEKQFKCDKCGKEFYKPTSLRIHETQTHSDLRPFTCTLCDKAFKRKKALDRHLKTHTGEKPFVCDICGATFTAEWSRKLHERTVHHVQHAQEPLTRQTRQTRQTRHTRQARQTRARRDTTDIDSDSDTQDT